MPLRAYRQESRLLPAQYNGFLSALGTALRRRGDSPRFRFPLFVPGSSAEGKFSQQRFGYGSGWLREISVFVFSRPLLVPRSSAQLHRRYYVPPTAQVQAAERERSRPRSRPVCRVCAQTQRPCARRTARLSRALFVFIVFSRPPTLGKVGLVDPCRPDWPSLSSRACLFALIGKNPGYCPRNTTVSCRRWALH